MSVPTPSTLAAIERLFSHLDYRTLGEIYCHADGDAFWDERRNPTQLAGLLWARALAARLGPGRSLYVGAGVAELPALLTEVLDLGREVRIASLNEAECDSLNATLASLGLGGRICFRCEDATEAATHGPFDHVSLVSVLTDPETYPTVSDLTYGRLHPLDLDLQACEEERGRLRALVSQVLGALQTPAWITTSVEEVPWLLDGAEARGLTVEADEEVIDTAVVGDPLGFLRLA